MAASFTCDGCGKSVEKPKLVGHVIRRDYCPDCAEEAEAFLEAEESLRKACVEQFTTARTALINTKHAADFKLPDVS